MLQLPGYKNIELLTELDNVIFYKGENATTNQAILIKLILEDLDERQILRINQQLHDCESLPIPKIILPHDIVFVEGQAAVIIDDTGAIYLSDILKTGPVPLELFWDYAINILIILHEIHKMDYVHGDLRPNNILINPESKAVFLTGFYRRQNKSTSYNIKELITQKEKFTYTSPEQTGRISWDVDHRSDIYSLGVIFYEMLTGSTPFASNDTQVRIYAHLAKKPLRLKKIDPKIPVALDNIIIKQLSKSLDERYQSVFGLRQDLLQCKKNVAQEKFDFTFELAQVDKIQKFKIPSKLYGAQENLIKLIETFNRVSGGSVELVSVKGGPGMGKTSLVQELQELIFQKHGFFARSKFEKEYKDTPYFSLTKAFQSLVQQILTEDEQSTDKWKEKLLNSLGVNGQLLIDFIPELEIIIGPQPPVTQLDPLESKNRFNHLFWKFTQTFTKEGYPLVLFLDNFHWADPASIQLIQTLLCDLESKYLLIIVVYRENLLQQSHALSLALDEIQLSGTQIQQIELTPLKLIDICQLIEDTLGFQQDYRSLAQLILEKTNGNPFFVRQLLQNFHDKHLVSFERDLGKWDWDLVQIQKAEIPQDVIELITQKIRDLPPEASDLLKMASCIGTQFDVPVLMKALKQNRDGIIRLLEYPLKAGLILPEKRDWDFPDNQIPFIARTSLKKIKRFHFLHSRVFQATYDLLSGKGKKQNHLLLGRLLLKNHRKAQKENLVYQIVNHLNLGKTLITASKEKLELAQLNLEAGKMSRASASHESAWKYYAYGTDLLDETSWDKDYQLTKELYLGRSECEYYSGNTEAAKPIFDLLLKYVKTKKERVEVIKIKINLFIKDAQYKMAIEVGIQALKDLFNEKIPANEAEINILSQVKMGGMHQQYERDTVEKLLYHNEMKNKNQIEIMDLIANILPAAFAAKKNLWIFFTLLMVEKSEIYGLTPVSAFGYMNYAVLLCTGLEDFQLGYSMGRLALRLNKKYQNDFLYPKLNFLFGAYICHWQENARECIGYLEKAYQGGQEQGDLISSGNSLAFLLKTHLIIGTPIEEIIRYIQYKQDFINQLQNPDIELIVEITKQISSLRDIDDNNSKPENRQIMQEKLQKSLRDCKDPQTQQWYYLVSAQLYYFQPDYPMALNMILESDKRIGEYSQLASVEHYFYYSLIITTNYADFSPNKQKKYWDILKYNLEKLQRLSNDNPLNYKGKFLTISAQMAAISGNFIETFNLYDEAIKTLSENSQFQNEAIANELATHYFMSRKKITVSRAYMAEAVHAFIKWGASNKVRQLEVRYPELFSNPLLKRSIISQDKREVVVADEPKEIIDLSRFISIFQNISREIVLDKLLERMLNLFLEHAGGERGYFLVEKNNHMIVHAEGIMERNPPIKICGYNLEDFADIPKGIIFYVIRTQNYVVLDNALKDGKFIHDPYIIKNKPKSILCIPSIHHGRVTSILYQENNLTTKAFAPKRIKMLNLLISQLGILIENSLLYENQAVLNQKLFSSKTELEKKIQFLEKKLQNQKSTTRKKSKKTRK